MSDCALPNGRWSGTAWRQPDHFELNDPKPLLVVELELEDGSILRHGFALNGRKVVKLRIGKSDTPKPYKERDLSWLGV